MGKSSKRLEGYEPWQFITQEYKRHDGARRRQRRLTYDLCPVCGKNAKRISATRCRDCFEYKGEAGKEAVRMLAVFLDCLDHDKAIDSRHIARARKCLNSMGVSADQVIGYRPGPDKRAEAAQRRKKKKLEEDDDG